MRFREVFGEVICDGCHSNVNSLNNLYAAKGRDYTIMITDSLMAKGCRSVLSSYSAAMKLKFILTAARI